MKRRTPTIKNDTQDLRDLLMATETIYSVARRRGVRNPSTLAYRLLNRLLARLRDDKDVRQLIITKIL